MLKITSYLSLKVPAEQHPQDKSSEVLTGGKARLLHPRLRRVGGLAEGCPQRWSSRVWGITRKSFTSAERRRQNAGPGRSGQVSLGNPRHAGSSKNFTALPAPSPGSDPLLQKRTAEEETQFTQLLQLEKGGNLAITLRQPLRTQKIQMFSLY